MLAEMQNGEYYEFENLFNIIILFNDYVKTALVILSVVEMMILAVVLVFTLF